VRAETRHQEYAGGALPLLLLLLLAAAAAERYCVRCAAGMMEPLSEPAPAKKASCWTPDEVCCVHRCLLLWLAAAASLHPGALLCVHAGRPAAGDGEAAWRSQLEENRGEPLQQDRCPVLASLAEGMRVLKYGDDGPMAH